MRRRVAEACWQEEALSDSEEEALSDSEEEAEEEKGNADADAEGEAEGKGKGGGGGGGGAAAAPKGKRRPSRRVVARRLHKFTFMRAPEIFGDVGGVGLWRSFGTAIGAVGF